jgi:lipopolysaccharide/colanic/teichoic acid biosynthesis glycosyltransferase
MRVTFSPLLRSSSLDELPELFNVLRRDEPGRPTPLLMSVRSVTRPTGRRHEVLPGITGWAQVNGRTTELADKFRLDV